MIPETTFWAVFPWVAVAVISYLLWWVFKGKK